MMWMKIKVAAAVVASMAMGAAGLAGQGGTKPAKKTTAAAKPRAGDEKSKFGLTPQTFEAYYKTFQPLPKEYWWRDEIPWHVRIADARIQAQKEDKPIMVVAASGGGFPLGET